MIPNHFGIARMVDMVANRSDGYEWWPPCPTLSIYPRIQWGKINKEKRNGKKQVHVQRSRGDNVGHGGQGAITS